jgi:hypothetical protein
MYLIKLNIEDTFITTYIVEGKLSLISVSGLLSYDNF